MWRELHSATSPRSSTTPAIPQSSVIHVQTLGFRPCQSSWRFTWQQLICTSVGGGTNISTVAYTELWWIGSIRQRLTADAITIMFTFISSRLDHYNTLRGGAPITQISESAKCPSRLSVKALNWDHVILFCTHSAGSQWPQECNAMYHYSIRFSVPRFGPEYLCIVSLVERRTRDRKVSSSNLGRGGGRINSFSGVIFVCWFLFGVRFTPMLPQWHVKDAGHFAKCASGRLYLNPHTPLTQRSRSGLTMPMSWHTVVIYPETRSHGTCQGTLGHSRLSSLSHCRLIQA